MVKTKILVVENETIIAKDIEDMLKGLGYDIPAISLNILRIKNYLPPLRMHLAEILKNDYDLMLEEEETMSFEFLLPN
jgi:CheY-like chemotaxis protein